MAEFVFPGEPSNPVGGYWLGILANIIAKSHIVLQDIVAYLDCVENIVG